MTDPKTMILEYIHQEDHPVKTKQLINHLLDSELSRKEAWKALDSLVGEGYIAELGGNWFISASGMELMGWIV
jgi:Fe2+ or Zn2+ uptake regulation protein